MKPRWRRKGVFEGQGFLGTGVLREERVDGNSDDDDSDLLIDEALPSDAPVQWNWDWPRTDDEMAAAVDPADGTPQEADQRDSPFSFTRDLLSVALMEDQDSRVCVGMISRSGNAAISWFHEKPSGDPNAGPALAALGMDDALPLIPLLLRPSDVDALDASDDDVEELVDKAQVISFARLSNRWVAAVGHLSGAIILFEVDLAGRPLLLCRPAGDRAVRCMRHSPYDGSLLVVFEGGILARIDKESISQVIHDAQHRRSASDDADSGDKFIQDDSVFVDKVGGWSLWAIPDVSRPGLAYDVALVGEQAPGLCEISSQTRSLRVILASSAFSAMSDGLGVPLTLGAYACLEVTAFSARAAARKAYTAVFSVARGLLSFKSDPERTGTRGSDADRDRSGVAAKGRFAVVKLVGSMVDSPRQIRKIEQSPGRKSFLAAADNLGRVLIIDPSDLSTLRILKGYRDAQVAWVSGPGKMAYLVVLAPRRGILEVWTPLGRSRIAAYRLAWEASLLPSSSSVSKIYVMTRRGELMELSLDSIAARSKESCLDGSTPLEESLEEWEKRFRLCLDSCESKEEAARITRTLADVPTVGRLAAILGRLGDSAPASVHCEVARAALRRVGSIGAESAASSVLRVRFELHQRLAQAFLLLESIQENGNEDSVSCSLLRDDQLGACQSSEVRQESTMPELTCRTFIRCHTIVQSRSRKGVVGTRLVKSLGLSLRRAVAARYFGHFMRSRSNGPYAVAAMEDTNAALDLSMLHVNDVGSLFIDFFLFQRLESLQNTPVDLPQSSLQLFLARVRPEIDPAVYSACLNTPFVANAVLLVRLCAVADGDDVMNGNGGPKWADLLTQLEAVLVLRRLAGTVDRKAQQKASQIYAAAFPSPAEPQDARKRFAQVLVETGNDGSAVEFIRDGVESVDRESVASVMVEAVRKRLATHVAVLPVEKVDRVVSPEVLAYILEAHDGSACSGDIAGTQSILEAAQDYLNITSIESVRCLQLAEAVAVILPLATD